MFWVELYHHERSVQFPTCGTCACDLIWALGQEDPLEKEMATHSIVLPGEPHRQRSLVGYNP